MAIIFKLVGYDKVTERQISRIDVPYWHVDNAKNIAGIHGIDTAILGIGN
jgi:hypothetical protein